MRKTTHVLIALYCILLGRINAASWLPTESTARPPHACLRPRPAAAVCFSIPGQLIFKTPRAAYSNAVCCLKHLCPHIQLNVDSHMTSQMLTHITLILSCDLIHAVEITSQLTTIISLFRYLTYRIFTHLLHMFWCFSLFNTTSQLTTIISLLRDFQAQ